MTLAPATSVVVVLPLVWAVPLMAKVAQELQKVLMAALS